MNKKAATPFLKWAGGKRQLLEQFNALYPNKLKEGKIRKYVEPFLGGGAVFFDLQKKYEFEKVVLNDINEELILTYKVVQNQCRDLIFILKKLEESFLFKDIDARKKMFYTVRKLFNNEKKTIDYKAFSKVWILHAAHLIFLNRTCFNGLYRLNKSGDFNVPFGKYKNPKICDEENLLNVSEALKNVILISGEYYNVEKYIEIDENTFVYIDPPYRPLTSSSNFTNYSKSGFNDDNQKELASWFKKLIKDNKAQVMLSNSDANDDFFYNLYEKDENNIFIRKVNASRTINSKGSLRGQITEIVVLHEESD